MWDSSKKEWGKCYKTTGTIGHIFFTQISKGKHYYLRLFLLTVKGANSFQSLRTVNNVPHTTFRSAAQALGLLDMDQDYYNALTEAASFMSGAGLHSMFIMILDIGPLANPKALFDRHLEHLSDDCALILRQKYVYHRPTEHDTFELCRYLIAQELQSEMLSLEKVGLAIEGKDLSRFEHSKGNASSVSMAHFPDFNDSML